MARTLVFEAEYPHPPEKVWTGIATSESLAKWLMKNDFEPVLGRRFQFRAKPVPGWSGIVDCEVLEMDEPRRMKWRWKSDHIDTTVTFTLTPTAGGTRLRLVHDGFAGWRGHFSSWMMSGGWKGMIAKHLRVVLDGGAPAKKDC
jgi:uncharacterized protein YndB with AHSA1/START domain